MSIVRSFFSRPGPGSALLSGLAGLSTSFPTSLPTLIPPLTSAPSTLFTPLSGFPAFRSFASTNKPLHSRGEFSFANNEMNIRLKAHMSDFIATTDHNIGAGFARTWLEMFLAGNEKEFFSNVLAICEKPSVNGQFTALLNKSNPGEALTSTDKQTEEFFNFLAKIHSTQLRTENDENNTDLKTFTAKSLEDELTTLISTYKHNLLLFKAMAFCITDGTHEIGLRYIDETNKWLLVDVNGLKVLPHKETAASILSLFAANANETSVKLKIHVSLRKLVNTHNNDVSSEEKYTPGKSLK